MPKVKNHAIKIILNNSPKFTKMKTIIYQTQTDIKKGITVFFNPATYLFILATLQANTYIVYN